MVSVGGAAAKSAAADLVFESIAGSVDGEDFAVVEETIEDRGGDHVIAEELAPSIERDVAGDHQRTSRIPGCHQLEEQIGATAVHRQVTQFIDDQKVDSAQVG